MRSQHNLHSFLCNISQDWPDLATTPLSLFYQCEHRLSSLSSQSSHCLVLGRSCLEGALGAKGGSSSLSYRLSRTDDNF